jgi:hypothetical protein
MRGKSRPLWLTAPLYVVVLAILALDVWAIPFWARVGGFLGGTLAVAATVVVVLLGTLLVIDARRQWRLSVPVDDEPAE